MMKKGKKLLCLALSAALGLTLLSGCGSAAMSAKGDPIPVTVWHYYNGVQQHTFEALTQEFNETVGAEAGIVVTTRSQGTIAELKTKVEDSIHQRVGAEETPQIFAAYADTAYEIDQAGKVADIGQYLTEEEQAAYIPAYLDEGRFGGGLKIFPVAKSTELLMVNDTVWQEFAAATGADPQQMTTWEGVADTAEAYYRWTDGLTPNVPNDGKAFFGRDAFANYMIIGSYQLGTELFQVTDGKVTLQIDKTAMRRLWDNFYVPYISGYYVSYGRFRSDDLRTGDIAAMVCSTSGAAYFPREVTHQDGSTDPITGAVYPLPNFEGTAPMAVQQGAGMVVIKSTQEQEAASVTFLKWLAQPEQNNRFAALSGYLPVTKAANDEAMVEKALDLSEEKSEILMESMKVGVGIAQDYTLYTSKAFQNGSAARNVAEHSMQDWAMKDRTAVLTDVQEGTPHDQAVAKLATDDNFEQWLAAFTSALEDAVK